MNCYQRISASKPSSGGRLSVNELWHSDSPDAWSEAFDHYWHYVKPQNMELENALDTLDLDRVRRMDEREWYSFLKDEYFLWKYTAPNRYGSGTRAQQRQCTAEHLKARCDGGPNSADNIVAACRYCNGQRHRAKRPHAPAAYRCAVRRRMAAGKWHGFVAQVPTP